MFKALLTIYQLCSNKPLLLPESEALWSLKLPQGFEKLSTRSLFSNQHPASSLELLHGKREYGSRFLAVPCQIRCMHCRTAALHLVHVRKDIYRTQSSWCDHTNGLTCTAQCVAAGDVVVFLGVFSDCETARDEVLENGAE